MLYSFAREIAVPSTEEDPAKWRGKSRVWFTLPKAFLGCGPSVHQLFADERMVEYPNSCGTIAAFV